MDRHQANKREVERAFPAKSVRTGSDGERKGMQTNLMMVNQGGRNFCTEVEEGTKERLATVGEWRCSCPSLSFRENGNNNPT